MHDKGDAITINIFLVIMIFHFSLICSHLWLFLWEKVYKMKNSRQTICFFFINEKEKQKKVLNNIMIIMLMRMKLGISLTVNDCPWSFVVKIYCIIIYCNPLLGSFSSSKTNYSMSSHNNFYALIKVFSCILVWFNNIISDLSCVTCHVYNQLLYFLTCKNAIKCECGVKKPTFLVSFS